MQEISSRRGWPILSNFHAKQPGDDEGRPVATPIEEAEPEGMEINSLIAEYENDGGICS